MSGGTNINCYTYGNIESRVTTVDIGGINGRIAGIAVDYECYYNGSAVHKTAGKEMTEKKASGTVVGEEIRTYSGTAAEMASAGFADTLNNNKAGMSEILKDVSTYLEDMTENNKEGLSHFLFYTGDGSDLNTWVKGETSPVFGSDASEVTVIPVVPMNASGEDTVFTDIVIELNGVVYYADNTGKINIEGLANGTYEAVVSKPGYAPRSVTVTACAENEEVVICKYGDVNGDGHVNLSDLGLMQQKLCDWDVEYVYSETADVNCSGRNDLSDLGLLQQYLCDWDVELGKAG